MALVKTLVAPGLYANHLEKPATVLSASQTPSSIYPITRIADGRPGQKFLFLAIAANDHIQADINQILNGLLDSWSGGLPVSFTVIVSGTGAVQEQTVSHIVSGSGARLINGASGNAQLIQDVLALSGEEWMLDLFARTDNADTPNQIELQNLQTGKYLNSSGAWVAGPVNTLSPVATALTRVTRSFTVEDFSITRRHDVRLRFRTHMTGSVANRQHNYDNILMYPGTNLAAVFGHNLDPLMTAALRSSSDAFASNDDLEATFAVDVPTFYASLAATIFKRYWRVPKLTGTNSALSGAVGLGEAGIYSARKLQASPRLGDLEIAEFLPQERVETPVSGEQWRVKRGQFQQRNIRLAFTLSSSKQAQWRAEILARTNHGVDPLVMVLDDSKTNSCVHARKHPEETSFTRSSAEREQTEIELQESSFGVILE